MINSKTFAFLTFGSAVFAVGCGTISANPIEKRSPSELSVDGGESNDPYACEVVATGDGSATRWQEEYGAVCKSTGAPCQYRGSGQYQHDEDTGLVTGHQELEMVCEHLCQIDDDCPAPASGTGVASCFVHPNDVSPDPVGTCIVRCDGGETCQDGFECTDEPIAGGWPLICIGEPYSFSISYNYEAAE